MLYKTVFTMIVLLSINTLADDNSKQTSKKQEVVAQYAKMGSDAGVLLLAQERGVTQHFSSGFADTKQREKIDTKALFEIGSASKIFTAISIFQLIEDGKLSLDTPLKKLYPEGNITALANFKGQNYWSDVTVAMLLNHTSGFIDYLNVYGDDVKAMERYSDTDKAYTFDSIVDLALSFGDANFKPGTKFKYCNTGYIILGDIITKISGVDWHDYIEQHIFEKAGVKHTYFGTRLLREIRADMPKGHFLGKAVSMPMALAGSAGEIVSDLDDLALLINLWREGAYYKKAETLETQMTQGYHRMDPAVVNLNYGYGLMKIGGYYGHGGETFGFASFVATSPENNNTYIVGSNDAKTSSMNLFMSVAGIEYELAHVKKNSIEK